MRLIQSEPLFDLEDRLLGWSRIARISLIDMMYLGKPEVMEEAWEKLGLHQATSCGVNILTISPRDRSVLLEWFQPFLTGGVSDGEDSQVPAGDHGRAGD